MSDFKGRHFGGETVRALRKGLARVFGIAIDVRGETRIVERAFGIGPFALTEAVRHLDLHLGLKAA